MKLHTDGGARGNPGPAAAGAVLSTDNGDVIKERGIYLGICTNNEAEYDALKLGLELALSESVTDITCYLDSELVVKQLKGEYKVKNERLQRKFIEINSIAKKFSSITYTHVPRKENKAADRIVNDVLDSSVTG